LRRKRQICHLVERRAILRLVFALIQSCTGCRSSGLASAPRSTLVPLQVVRNRAVRLGARFSTQVTETIVRLRSSNFTGCRSDSQFITNSACSSTLLCRPVSSLPFRVGYVSQVVICSTDGTNHTDCRTSTTSGQTILILNRIASQSISLFIGAEIVTSVDTVRDLGVLLDSQLSMKPQIAKVAATCFFHLRRLRQIRRRCGQEFTTRLVLVFINSRIEYCNSVFAGLPVHLDATT
jgi:hypothetical protein